MVDVNMYLFWFSALVFGIWDLVFEKGKLLQDEIFVVCMLLYSLEEMRSFRMVYEEGFLYRLVERGRLRISMIISLLKTLANSSSPSGFNSYEMRFLRVVRSIAHNLVRL
jgi:hypothetical protein